MSFAHSFLVYVLFFRRFDGKFLVEPEVTKLSWIDALCYLFDAPLAVSNLDFFCNPSPCIKCQNLYNTRH